MNKKEIFKERTAKEIREARTHSRAGSDLGLAKKSEPEAKKK